MPWLPFHGIFPTAKPCPAPSALFNVPLTPPVSPVNGLTLIPFIPINNLQEQILLTFSEILPNEVYSFIEGTLKDLVKKRGTLLSFSFLVVLWLASNSMNAVLAGFGGSSNISQRRNLLSQRLL